MVKLIPAIKNDTLNTFNNLYEEYKGALYNYISYLTRRESETEAEDLFQETWLRVARGLLTIKENQNPKAWIYTIATNLYRDLLRKRKIRRTFWQSKNHIQANHFLKSDKNQAKTPAEESEMVDTGRVIMDAVRELPEKLRQVFILKQIQDLSYPEISSILNLSQGTAKSRMHRAIKKLRQNLNCLDPQITTVKR